MSQRDSATDRLRDFGQLVSQHAAIARVQAMVQKWEDAWRQQEDAKKKWEELRRKALAAIAGKPALRNRAAGPPRKGWVWMAGVHVAVPEKAGRRIVEGWGPPAAGDAVKPMVKSPLDENRPLDLPEKYALLTAAREVECPVCAPLVAATFPLLRGYGVLRGLLKMRKANSGFALASEIVADCLHGSGGVEEDLRRWAGNASHAENAAGVNSKPGRPPKTGDTNPAEDRKEAAAWRKWRARQIQKRNHHASFKQYANETGKDAAKVSGAVDRDRKRKAQRRGGGGKPR